jgi:DNA modification methylase
VTLASYYADDWLTVYAGDARVVLPKLAPSSVNTVMTSPPYWDLRHNGTEMVSAIHVLQGFVVQHMLQRLDAESWGNWYAPIRGDMREPRGGT